MPRLKACDPSNQRVRQLRKMKTFRYPPVILGCLDELATLLNVSENVASGAALLMMSSVAVAKKESLRTGKPCDVLLDLDVYCGCFIEMCYDDDAACCVAPGGFGLLSNLAVDGDLSGD